MDDYRKLDEAVTRWQANAPAPEPAPSPRGPLIRRISSLRSWSGKFRFYFNRREDYPLVWAIDDGDALNSLLVSVIDCYAPTSTRYNASVDNVEQPRAWMEGVGQTEVVEHQGELIAAIYKLEGK